MRQERRSWETRIKTQPKSSVVSMSFSLKLFHTKPYTVDALAYSNIEGSNSSLGSKKVRGRRLPASGSCVGHAARSVGFVR